MQLASELFDITLSQCCCGLPSVILSSSAQFLAPYMPRRSGSRSKSIGFVGDADHNVEKTGGIGYITTIKEGRAVG